MGTWQLKTKDEHRHLFIDEGETIKEWKIFILSLTITAEFESSFCALMAGFLLDCCASREPRAGNLRMQINEHP